MDLIKELLTTKVEEEQHVYSDIKYNRFKKILGIVAKELDHLYVITKDGSNFSKLVAELGGDPAIVKEAYEHLKKLDDVMADLEMSVGMAQEPPADNE